MGTRSWIKSRVSGGKTVVGSKTVFFLLILPCKILFATGLRYFCKLFFFLKEGIILHLFVPSPPPKRQKKVGFFFNKLGSRVNSLNQKYRRYQKLLLTWLTNLPKLSFCFLFVTLGQKLTEILIFKLKCGENRICTFLWVLMGFIYFRWPYTYITCSEFWQH